MFLETVQRPSSHHLIRQTIPVIHDSLAEEILSTCFLEAWLVQVHAVASKTDICCLPEEYRCIDVFHASKHLVRLD